MRATGERGSFYPKTRNDPVLPNRVVSHKEGERSGIGKGARRRAEGYFLSTTNIRWYSSSRMSPRA